MGVKANGCKSVNWINVAQDEGQMAGSFEHCNECSGATNAGECFGLLNDYQIIKIDAAS
jgi:hypothetical protein